MTLVFSLVLILATVVATAYFARQIVSAQLTAQQQLGQGLVGLMQPALQGLAGAGNIGQLQPLLRSISDDPAIEGVTITDSRGAVLYALQHPAVEPNWLTRVLTRSVDKTRTLVADFSAPGNGTGHIVLTLSYRPLNQSIEKILVNSVVVLGGLLLLVIALTYLLLVRFTAPLKPLTQLAREVAHGNWMPDIALIPSGSREIQELNQAFTDGSTTMRNYIQTLEETRTLFEHSENRLRTLISGMREILLELDTQGRIVFLNPAWARLTGFSVDSTLGRSFTDFVVNEQAIADLAVTRLSRLREKNREICLHSANGKRLWLHLDAEAQTDADGRFTGVIATLGDITQSVELNKLLTKYQEELYYLSITDPLTGLYNRRHFDTQLDVILADHLPRQEPVCLLIIDLDGFKFINDTYGHPFGDKALRAISTLLIAMFKGHGYVARLAGDEFAVILRKTGLEDATRTANKLHAAISTTQLELAVGDFQLRCSIGVASAPMHGQNAQDLVSAADVALYHSKRRGRNRVEVLSPDNSKAVMSIFNQGFQLRAALGQGNLVPAFQPICDIHTGLPMAYEALARMRHNGDMVHACDFITVAEELGLTREIDLHIIQQSLLLAPAGYGLFLNIDPRSFNDPDFVNNLTALLQPACEMERSITIEITERENIIITDTLLAAIRDLRSIGCKLALDDFGSGYSTYRFLNLFRPEYLKIEGTFVRGMLDHESNRKIVQHIHELATSFGIQTIAESVENEATLSALRRMGIAHAQGWHMGAAQFNGESTTLSV
jgi:diguanylate cyclase (GGDEF)-like protein/PAS domain S-box-containing protein